MPEKAYEQLARPIQRILWDMGWDRLRPIQVDTIGEIFGSDRDLILSARTAAGKTEAAFLPILSKIYENRQPSIQAVYVGPLKALINDQFRRLEELCGRAEIPVHRWHGDVDAGQKRALLEKPAGVLLITPESIESLFVNRSSFLAGLFRHLAFVVIDEVHAMVGRERGTHLRSLLYRLERHVDGQFRIVALSATLGDAIAVYADWLRPGEAERVQQISDSSDQKRILFRLHGYLHSRPATPQRRPAGKTPPDPGAVPPPDSDEPTPSDDDAELPAGIVDDMYQAFAGRKNLVFTNRKQDVEWFADSLNDHCRRLGRPQEFLVHHGSLSKEVREFTEEAMRGDRPHTTFCSATLELGIDIGNVAAVGQIDPPWSVSSLVQRLGRSGRKEEEPQVMRLYVTEDEPQATSTLVDRLHAGLLQGIALTELMLARWVEPPDLDDLDLSTLVQQILSVLAETGGIRADRLHERLVAKGAFRRVDRALFLGLLRSLSEHQLIEQMPEGDLILAPAGERLVSHYDFYSAFATSVEYSVLYGGRPIGTLPAMAVPAEGDHLLLAGRRWEVAGVDHQRSEILVVPARGRKRPQFFGAGGDLHPRVRQAMREVLLASHSYAYLNDTAARLLEDARQAARSAELADRSLIPLVGSNCLWFTWTGSKVQRTLLLMAAAAGLEVTDQAVAIHFRAKPRDVVAAYREMAQSAPDPIALARRMPVKWMRKFDPYIAEELLVQSLAHDAIDAAHALESIRDLPGTGKRDQV